MFSIRQLKFSNSFQLTVRIAFRFVGKYRQAAHGDVSLGTLVVQTAPSAQGTGIAGFDLVSILM